MTNEAMTYIPVLSTYMPKFVQRETENEEKPSSI
jgi:hypothetical protein